MSPPSSAPVAGAPEAWRHPHGALALDGVLTQELLDFSVTISETGRDTYGAREGAHDDLVLATALPVWYAERGPKRPTATDPAAWKKARRQL